MPGMRNELSLLIADDDSSTRHVRRPLLCQHGGQVVAEARDGEKAVELCETHKPYIAFLDLDTPKLHRHLAAERIKHNTPGLATIV